MRLSQPATAAAPVTLFCLPYAGGNAAIYRDWRDALPPWIDCVPLDLPGHGRLRAMPPCSDWPTLARALLDAIGPLPAGDFAIFGHSMGALVALELAHALRERDGREPVWLGVAACAAPLERDYETKWLECGAAQMVDELRRLGGTPEELLGDAEFLELALPVLRADFHLCATYVRRWRTRAAPLACPVCAFGGRQDSLSGRKENLSSWRHETTGAFGERMLEGGHFFVETARVPLLREIAGALCDAVSFTRQPSALAAAG